VGRAGLDLSLDDVKTLLETTIVLRVVDVMSQVAELEEEGTSLLSVVAAELIVLEKPRDDCAVEVEDRSEDEERTLQFPDPGWHPVPQ
jgi:predicted RecB family endonuclease